MQLQNDPKCTQILRNIPKHYFRVNGVDWDCPLRKIPTSLRGTNFCISCTSSPCFHRVSCSYETIPNAAKHYETHQNMSLGSNGADRVHSLQKNRMRIRGSNFCINCSSSACFAPISCSNETIQNAPKYNKTHQYMS